MKVSKEKGASSEEKPERPPLEFWDSEKVGEIPNENFPMVITATIAKFDASIIHIDRESTCEIITEHFEKLGLKREKLWPYEGTNL